MGFISAPDTTRVRIKVHVQPNAAKSELAGLHGESLKIRIKSPPLDHAANDECARFLAELFGVKRAAVALLLGDKSREKVFEIFGLTLTDAQNAIKNLLAPSAATSPTPKPTN